MLHAVLLGFALSALWWFLSGYTAALLLGLGAGSILLVVWIARRMDVIDHESHPIHMAPKGVLYFPWLIWEIAKANLDVAKIIVQTEMPIQPQVIELTAGQVSDAGLVAFANSITLTPGTVTIGVEGNAFLVHALTDDAAAGLASGEMDRRVTDMEGMQGVQGAPPPGGNG